MTNHDLTPEVVARLLASSDPYLSCDECFDELDAEVDAALTADGAGAVMSVSLRAHLATCGACQEEADSLATLVAGDYGLTEAEATARLAAAVTSR